MPESTPGGRLLAVGDIHGCHVALDVLLERLALTSSDVLVVLGDVVDRGPGSRQAIDKLMEIRSACTLKFILGNHEEMMLDALAGRGWQRWLEFGGMDTLNSYGGLPEDIPPEHLEFLQSGLPYWETETDVFVHANLQPGVPLRNQSAQWLRWTHLTGLEQPHDCGKRVICGHTPQPSGLPGVLDGWVCLDTLAYGGRYLTCLDVLSGELHQAQQTGYYRSGLTLDELT